MNVQKLFSERLKNILRTFRKPLKNVQETFKNVQETFKNVQKTFSERLSKHFKNV